MTTPALGLLGALSAAFVPRRPSASHTRPRPLALEKKSGFGVRWTDQVALPPPMSPRLLARWPRIAPNSPLARARAMTRSHTRVHTQWQGGEWTREADAVLHARFLSCRKHSRVRTPSSKQAPYAACFGDPCTGAGRRPGLRVTALGPQLPLQASEGVGWLGTSTSELTPTGGAVLVAVGEATPAQQHGPA